MDTCLREDYNQTRKADAAKNLGTVRCIVLNILKEDPGIKRKPPGKTPLSAQESHLPGMPFFPGLIALINSSGSNVSEIVKIAVDQLSFSSYVSM